MLHLNETALNRDFIDSERDCKSEGPALSWLAAVGWLSGFLQESYAMRASSTQKWWQNQQKPMLVWWVPITRGPRPIARGAVRWRWWAKNFHWGVVSSLVRRFLPSREASRQATRSISSIRWGSRERTSRCCSGVRLEDQNLRTPLGSQPPVALPSSYPPSSSHCSSGSQMLDYPLFQLGVASAQGQLQKQ